MVAICVDTVGIEVELGASFELEGKATTMGSTTTLTAGGAGPTAGAGAAADTSGFGATAIGSFEVAGATLDSGMLCMASVPIAARSWDCLACGNACGSWVVSCGAGEYQEVWPGNACGVARPRSLPDPMESPSVTGNLLGLIGLTKRNISSGRALSN